MSLPDAPVAALKVHAGSIDDLQRTGRLVTYVDGIPILVLRARHRLVAIAALCPHMGYPLECAPLVGQSVLECPAHRWRFDVVTGTRPRHWWTPPASRQSSRRLRHLPIEVIDGHIFIAARPAPAQTAAARRPAPDRSCARASNASLGRPTTS
jgi:nitrite reductase/ring-hydroxylating ferredoxin subunit